MPDPILHQLRGRAPLVRMRRAASNVLLEVGVLHLAHGGDGVRRQQQPQQRRRPDGARPRPQQQRSQGGWGAKGCLGWDERDEVCQTLTADSAAFFLRLGPRVPFSPPASPLSGRLRLPPSRARSLLLRSHERLACAGAPCRRRRGGRAAVRRRPPLRRARSVPAPLSSLSLACSTRARVPSSSAARRPFRRRAISAHVIRSLAEFPRGSEHRRDGLVCELFDGRGDGTPERHGAHCLALCAAASARR